jgi:hypothetical protein
MFLEKDLFLNGQLGISGEVPLVLWPKCGRFESVAKSALNPQS